MFRMFLNENQELRCVDPLNLLDIGQERLVFWPVYARARTDERLGICGWLPEDMTAAAYLTEYPTSERTNTMPDEKKKESTTDAPVPSGLLLTESGVLGFNVQIDDVDNHQEVASALGEAITGLVLHMRAWEIPITRVDTICATFMRGRQPDPGKTVMQVTASPKQ